MATQFLSTPNAALAIGLLNVIVGYVGADAATETLIERILWPQHANAGFEAHNLVRNAVLFSAGGPLHRVAIKALDGFHKHSLFKGAGHGHMLGTAFFPDTGLSYKLYKGRDQAPEKEWVRNGLLTRILKCLPYTQPTATEKGAPSRPMRQRITVNHLELFYLGSDSVQDAVSLGDDTVTGKTLIAIVASELPTLLLATIIALGWNISMSLLLLGPLSLKLAAAATTLEREQLDFSRDNQTLKTDEQDRHPIFEIHIPGEGFQIITGPCDLVLPFFRHYGHPVRCRWREVTQMFIVAALGACYPFTFVGMLWMPLEVQALWACYQIYLVFSMLIVRFVGGDVWGTTEERMAKALAFSRVLGRNGMVMFKDRKGFVMGARLTQSVHGSYTDGKSEVAHIISR